MGERLAIGVTLGDPAGSGPDILDKALSALGDPGNVHIFGPDELVESIAARHPGCIPVATSHGLHGISQGRYTSQSGAASIKALHAACTGLATAALAALVTGPISKQALTDAGIHHPGQTEMVAEACGVDQFAMMLAGPRLRVALATTHVALRDLPAALSPESIEIAARLTDVFLRRDLGIPSPRLGILAINPHGGDNGRFGDEDTRIVLPAVKRLLSLGIDARGPIPADTAFHRAWNGEFDALVAMYHDQGLGPLKLVHFNDAVNITLGLPRPRCSPDHGPAYDLAIGGRADPTSMTEALRFALAVRDGPINPIDP